ncbi:Ribosomal protein L35 [Candidatus Endolissoclinum faulkneri L2]|uniref:Large ribosomal subunit protein bL35 n=1 Tax=Candidatus Endolissoclinum faulkneri L2 TaxID=1193729 RepID=K7YPH4_9PROT|nr:50S ribosomal protein L35 [Candidatus Endolissoclinum faulkneri]AFX99417.1 Ribosomal protein L35 [Candidatus Endolissoclinum faulkneri L2]
MPKMKTKSSIKRRFRVTKSGNIKGNGAYKRHMLRRRSQKMKRQASGTFLLSESDQKIIKRFMPYC